MESRDVKGLVSSAAQLKPHRTHRGQFGAERFGHVVTVRVPLQGRKTPHAVQIQDKHSRTGEHLFKSGVRFSAVIPPPTTPMKDIVIFE